MNHPFWLSVDTDDLCHLPRARGHPRRSRARRDGEPTDREFTDGWRTTGYTASQTLLDATDACLAWLEARHAADTTPLPVTLFIIAEQLEDPAFRARMERFLALPQVTFGCHGWGHRCWSAWPEDPEGFAHMLTAADTVIRDFAGVRHRPWFRAPGGYIAPWMAAPLAAAGYRVDTSVNPSRWVVRKTGSSRSWPAVMDAMQSAGLIERPWLTTALGPACGPALHLHPFALPARAAWRRATSAPARPATNTEIEDAAQPLATLYWHLLDHRRERRGWTPPIA